MNPNNLIGKTKEQIKSMYEVDLIAEFEMEYGDPDHWSEETTEEFNQKWEEIQKKYGSNHDLTIAYAGGYLHVR
jgi:NAD/NADP transhydrogenase alpha subunit